MTSSSLHISALQMVSSSNLQENLAQAKNLLEVAAARGSQLAVLPENFAMMGSKVISQYGESRSNPGPILTFLADMSRQLNLWIVAGSSPLRERRDGLLAPRAKVYPSCTVWDNHGHCVEQYDKLHLFDVDVDDGVGRYRESDHYQAGAQAVCLATPWAKIGLTICYDLRFPELYRVLAEQGAQIFIVPAAFTEQTGKAHWDVLLRARAIENQCFVVAPNQGGDHGGKRRTWGHSSIIDPWGTVLACHTSPGPAVVSTKIELADLIRLRTAMPVAGHRRSDLC